MRRQFYTRLERHLARAEPGSLAQLMAATPASRAAAPEQQVPQWLFAFDPVGMTTFRTLALLAAHPDHAARAREEIREQEESAAPHLPYLRACVLRVSAALADHPDGAAAEHPRDNLGDWGHAREEGRPNLRALFSPRRRSAAVREPLCFAPEVWLDERCDPKAWPLIPFSGGPAICPGRHLVLLLTSTVLASLIAERQVWLKPLTRLDARRPLPGTLDNYSLRFVFDR